MTKQQILGWFEENYPKLKQSGIKLDIVGFCVNDPGRRNFSARQDILYRQVDGTYVAYNEAKHGRWTRQGQPDTRRVT